MFASNVNVIEMFLCFMVLELSGKMSEWPLNSLLVLIVRYLWSWDFFTNSRIFKLRATCESEIYEKRESTVICYKASSREYQALGSSTYGIYT